MKILTTLFLIALCAGCTIAKPCADPFCSSNTCSDTALAVANGVALDPGWYRLGPAGFRDTVLIVMQDGSFVFSSDVKEERDSWPRRAVSVSWTSNGISADVHAFHTSATGGLTQVRLFTDGHTIRSHTYTKPTLGAKSFELEDTDGDGMPDLRIHRGSNVIWHGEVITHAIKRTCSCDLEPNKPQERTSQ